MTDTIPYFVTYRDIYITNARGEKFLVTHLIQQISIFEDCFSNTITGEALITDGDSAKDKLRFIGNEKISIEFVAGNGKMELKEFFVYAAGNNMRPTISSEVYTISFISVESVLNQHTRVYQAIEGSNAAAVQTLMGYIGTTKPFEIEETVGVFKFVMPSWTPFEGINWYAGRSVSSESGGSYFLFFENWNGFNFKSVESMIKEDAIFEYIYEPAGGNPVIKDLRNIREFEVLDLADSLEGVNEHYTTLWNTDLVRKKIVKRRFEYEEDNKGSLNLNLIGGATETGFGFNLKERRDVFGSQPVVRGETRNVHSQTQTYYYDSIQTKLSAIRQFSKFKIKFLVFGNKDVMPGKVIEIKMNKATPSDSKDVFDKTITGRYLVTAVHKIYKADDFQMSVEAVKDSRND